MQTLHIDIPDQILISLKETPEELSREIRISAAAKLYELGKLSSSQAAKLSGLSRIAFLETVGKYGVSVFGQSKEDLKQDMVNA